MDIIAEGFKVMPPYFLIKVNKEEQRKRREMIGSLYLSPDHVYMTRELQASEIVQIGEAAHEYFPKAKIGDMLIYHHFVTGKADEKKQLFYYIDEDKEFEYFVVTAFAIPGEKNMCYGVWNGKEIIPNPDYIFLEMPKEETGENFELQFGLEKVGTGKFKTLGSGLAVPVEQKKSRKQWTDLMKQNSERIKQISIASRMTQEVINEIKKLEKENYKISKEINKRRYEVHAVVFAPSGYYENVSGVGEEEIVSGTKVFMLNQACHTEVEFMGDTYIVAEMKYFACTENWYKDAIDRYKKSY